ncbi:MAG: hypothetical protein DMF58_18870 [Acidobacteria bacterium]|nr:MAG: hypothetical protein DMF58_18870 [Acidobacteriota bacterium]
MRFRKQLWPVIAVAVVVLGFSQRAVFGQGVDDPNGVFQLEGNAMKDASVCFPSLAAPPCSGGDTLVTFGANTDDWASLTHALATTGIITDPTGHADDILSGGGSKDIYDFSKWAWKQTANTSVQAKDDIAHAFAAAYQLANGHTAIYFGMDRFDNSGDATAGFWFLQDATVLVDRVGLFDRRSCLDDQCFQVGGRSEWQPCTQRDALSRAMRSSHRPQRPVRDRQSRGWDHLTMGLPQ